MVTIGGIAISVYGLKLIKFEGLLNMPSRLDPYTYDWGDEIEPLVHDEDMSWQSRDFTAEMIFEGDKFNVPIESLTSFFSSLGEVELVTDYLTCDVTVKSVTVLQKYQNNIYKVLVSFNENLPHLTESLGSPTPDSGFTIDGYSFKHDFGTVITKLNVIEVPELKTTRLTVYKQSNVLSESRKLYNITLDCVMVYDNIPALKLNIAKLKYLLSRSGLRELNLNKTYECFIGKGFEVKLVGTNLAKFTIALNTTSITSDDVKWILENGIWMPDNVWTANGIWYGGTTGVDWFMEDGIWKPLGAWTANGIWYGGSTPTTQWILENGIVEGSGAWTANGIWKTI